MNDQIEKLLDRKDAREIARVPRKQLIDGEVNVAQLPEYWCVWIDGDDLVYGDLRPPTEGEKP